MSLVAYYPLNGDTLDYSGNSLDGTASSVTYTNGKISQCGSFDGTGYISVPHNNKFNLGAKGTLCAWVKPNRDYPSDTTSYVFRGIAGKVSGGGTGQQSFYMGWYGTNTDRMLRAGVGDSSAVDTVTVDYDFQQKFTHVCMTWDGIYIKLYVNGTLLAQRESARVAQELSSSSFTVGYPFSAWDGLIDEVRLYDNTLSEKEIKELAKAKILHYTFDDNVSSDGGIVRDISGYQNDATLASATAPTWTTDSKIGSGAYEFNGNDSVIERNMLSILGTSSFTVNLWVYLNESDVRDVFLGNYTTTNNFNIERYTNDQLRFYWNGTSLCSSNNAIPVFEWCMITAIRDKENSLVKMFVNGNIVYNQTQNLTDLTSLDGSLRIGRDSRIGTTATKGLIDDVRIYVTALSDNDIKELYQTRASLDSHGNLFANQFVEDIEPTVNLLYDNGAFTPSIGGLTVNVSLSVLEPNKKFRITSTSFIGSYTYGSFRFYVPLAKLINGKTYNLSFKYKIVQGEEFYMTDWCDTAITRSTTDYGEYKFESAYGMRATYDSIYCFMDFRMSSNSIVDIWDIQLEQRNYPTPFIAGTREQSDSLPVDFPYGANSIMSNGISNFEKFSEVGITDGLIAYYPFDGNAKDYSGRGNHGIVNDATVSSGINGQCYSFDGTDNYIEYGDIFKLGLGDMSWTFWAKPNEVTLSSGYVFSKSYDGGELGRYFANFMNDKFRMAFAWTASHTNYYSNSNAEADKWVHIGITLKRDGHLNIYINGNLDVSYLVSSYVDVDMTTSRPFRIGSHTSGDGSTPSGFFSGLIDDIRIYSRALSTEEIKILYNLTAGDQRMIQTSNKLYIKGKFIEV